MKFTRLSTFLFISIIVLPAICRADLVQYLPFDADGTALVGADAKLYNGAQVVSGGKFGGALSLVNDNSANSSTYNAVGQYAVAEGFKGILGANPRTVSLWVKTPANTNKGIFFLGWGGSDGTAKNRYDFGLQASSTTQLRNELNSGYNLSLTSSEITDNTWHHVAMTFDGTTTAFYLDGAAYGTSTNAPNTTSKWDMVIGTGVRQLFDPYNAGTSQDRWFSGLIDEVRIYDHVLTPLEIQALMGPGDPMVVLPVPADGQSQVLPSAVLAWQTVDADNPTFDINIGTTAACDEVVSGLSTGSAKSFDLSSQDIQAGTTYYWRVDIHQGAGEYAGSVWSFTTGGKALNPVPADGKQASGRYQYMAWDGDSLAASYKVYFGQGGQFTLVGEYAATRIDFADIADAMGVDVIAEGLYQWRVDTIDAQGNFIAEGDIWNVIIPVYLPIRGRVIEDFNGYETDADLAQVWTGDAGLSLSIDEMRNVMTADFSLAASGGQCDITATFSGPVDLRNENGRLAIGLLGCDLPQDIQLSVIIDDGADQVRVKLAGELHDNVYRTWAVSLSKASSLDLSHVVSLKFRLSNTASQPVSGSLAFNRIEFFKKGLIPGEVIAGDFNLDQLVDNVDLAYLAENWLRGDYDVFASAYTGTGLVASYNFDGSLADSSGNGFDASESTAGSATYQPAGISGNALLMDGSYYVNFPAGVFDTVTSDLTLSLWYMYPQGNIQNESVELGLPQVFEGLTPDCRTMTPEVIAADSLWHHAAIVKSGLTVSIYVDGLLHAIKTLEQDGDSSAAGMTRLEFSPLFETEVAIDDVRIYNVSLNHEAVASLAAGDSGSVTQPLAPLVCPADINADGIVNLPDMAAMCDNWINE